MRGFGRQRGGALQKGSDSGQSATRLRARCRTLELGGDVLVGKGRCLRPVPCASVGIELLLCRVRERRVDLTPLARTGPPIDGRANERMAEHDPRPHDQQAFRFDRVRSRFRDAEELGCPPHECRIAGRIGGGKEQQPLRVAWEGRQPAHEALLDPGRQR